MAFYLIAQNILLFTWAEEIVQKVNNEMIRLMRKKSVPLLKSSTPTASEKEALVSSVSSKAESYGLGEEVSTYVKIYG